MTYAVVTGATHGIGAAISRKLATEHIALAICSRNEAELEALKTELETLGSPKVVYQVADMAVKEQVVSFTAFVQQAFPQTHILINNAGIFLPGNICEEADGQLEQMMQVNLYSAYTLTRQLVPAMKERREGHIFNICSVASLKSYPFGGSYSISKYALLGFSDNLREELRNDGIRVTAICPGATQSRSWSNSGMAEERLMKAEDVATIVWATYTLSQQTDVELVVMRPQLGDL